MVVMNATPPPPLPTDGSAHRNPDSSARRRLAIKLLTIATAIVLLQVPLWWVESKRVERAQRNQDVVNEITKAWGGPQRVLGPVLSVPARRLGEGAAESGDVWLRLAPAELRVGGELMPQELRRGIYRAQVYTGRLRFSGRFEWPTDWDASRFAVDWARAELMCPVGHAGGLDVVESLNWSGQEVALDGGTGSEVWPVGVHGVVPVAAGERAWTFTLALAVNGSGSLELAPLAQSMSVALQSLATAPSFVGARLPSNRAVTEDGFQATWDIGPLGRSVPTAWVGETGMDWRMDAKLREAAFGVSLLPGVTDYRAIERAVTYGILFLVTVYAGYFLSEMMGGRSLHLLNYLLVGAALCLFFLALLSLAELTGFGVAYGVAAVATTGLIVSYSRAVLGGGRQAGGMAVLLGGIFAYLFLVLRLEDLSLVSGTALLFVLLGGVMYATRHLQFDEFGRLHDADAGRRGRA